MRPDLSGADMTDDEFLGYVSLHSKTERALFSRDLFDRLLRLSGKPPLPAYGPSFIAVHAEVAGPLVERARKRLKFRVIEGGKK